VANNTCFFQGKELLFGDAVFFRVQPPRGGEHSGGTNCVDVMYDAVERLGRIGAGTQDGNSSSSFCTWGGRAATAAAVSVSSSPHVSKKAQYGHYQPKYMDGSTNSSKNMRFV
jgi:hypothetical protein